MTEKERVHTCTQALHHACQMLDVTQNAFSGVGSHACCSLRQCKNRPGAASPRCNNPTGPCAAGNIAHLKN